MGKGIKPGHLNDHKIARVLEEKLFDAGITSLFVEIALEAAEREGVGTGRLHLDATSFSDTSYWLEELLFLRTQHEFHTPKEMQKTTPV